jgi:hypothetical protein
MFYNSNFLKPTDAERIEFYKQLFAVRRIWRAWFRAITDPGYKLCRERLLKEYREMNS